ncbi:carbohydrate kinase [Stappia sp. GBMRC 2046]|uniref:Carbohydrate kinase n=1 Tax=Stappia sediminis TaxID=2692190 RepID=A0A7X3S740_9HYPH|nr:FGGY-family carbohydrate kinase [Stappia sediminis]MXN64380.1 carbohydrate kinase [Stappia sediminis]
MKELSEIRHAAVVDIGKTNVKLAAVDLQNLEETSVITRANTVLNGPPYPHYDTEGIWQFILEGLRELNSGGRIDAITVTTHGASGVMLDEAGELATPVLDYEYEGPDDLAAEYDAIRPDFAETGSPRLPLGLNLAAQFHWLLATVPALRERTATVMTYPQYWAYRLCGVPANEMTPLGAHTDLWNHREQRFSSIVAKLGLEEKMAPLRRASDRLGRVLPGVAGKTGLSADTSVFCGIHDSNASLLLHLKSREAPFSVVSTGTWVIAMAIGGRTVHLDPARDCLMNINAFGDPVPSARFMGGREYELMGGDANVQPTPADIEEVLNNDIMLLPSVDTGSGPFIGRTASWAPEEPAQGSGKRSAALAFYLALMTAHCLDLIGHRGEIVVEGAFSRNDAYLAMLAAATDAPVHASVSATGTSVGAALLILPASQSIVTGSQQPVTPLSGGRNYMRRWKERISA